MNVRQVTVSPAARGPQHTAGHQASIAWLDAPGDASRLGGKGRALVAADAAGVAFTADPLSDAADHVVLNAAWGLGPSVVDGHVEADTWRIDRATRAVIAATTGDKPTRAGAMAGAAREPVEPALRRLLAAGSLAQVDDVRWLRATEVALAVRGLAGAPGAAAGVAPASATEPGAAGAARPTAIPQWRQLVVARQALHAWQQMVTAPPALGAPPKMPAADEPAKREAPAAGEAPPATLLIAGQAGSPGVATGRVRLIAPDTLVPDVAAGDVLVAHNAGRSGRRCSRRSRRWCSTPACCFSTRC